VKKIFIDPGAFYTKVGAFERTNNVYKFYGKSFFPSFAAAANNTNSKSIIYYTHRETHHTVGYDCSNLTQKQIKERSTELDRLICLKKIIFDYSDNNEELEVNIAIDIGSKFEEFENICKLLGEGPSEISALRGLDNRIITKKTNVKFNLISTGDGVLGYLRSLNIDFSSALVIDIGHSTTKIYAVNKKHGVEIFKSIALGVSYYYEKILKLLQESGTQNFNLLWLIKQIEFGFDNVEVSETEGDFNVSLVLDNIRWDLNKDFKSSIIDILTNYYTNTTKWADLLVITGGGSRHNGEILRTSLNEGGFKFKNIHIEKLPVFSVLDGFQTALQASVD